MGSRQVAFWIAAALTGTMSGPISPLLADDEKQAIIVHVLVPADATVVVDGYYKTKSTGSSRRFITPPLLPGKSYTYSFKVTSRGKSVTRDIKIRHGAKNVFDLRPEFQAEVTPGTKLSAAEAHKIGVEVYIYGYPLVTMEM